MSTPFYDLASVVVLPSGYKSGKIYAQKPLTTDGQLTFTRASTATRVNASGLIETVSSGVPRLDYTNSSCPKLLLEPQRTNIAQYSQSFDNGYWEKGSVATITANSIVSPDGTQNADTLTANGSGSLFARVNCYLGTTQTCSNSIFVKKANHRYVGLRNSGTTSQHDVFDFDTKTWTNNSGATLSYEEHANGWFRLKSTNTDAVNLNYYWSVIPALNTSGAETATVSNLSVYIWGAQAEQNAAYCTSYIPTTSAAVTRLADYASKTGISSLIGQSEGVWYWEGNLPQVSENGANSSVGLINTARNVNVNTAISIQYTSGNSRIYVSLWVGNGTFTPVVDFFANGYSVGSYVKIAFAYKSGSSALYINGTLVASSSASFTSSTTMSEIYYHDNTVYYAYTGQQKLAQSLLFKTRLTNAQLAELTTL